MSEPRLPPLRAATSERSEAGSCHVCQRGRATSCVLPAVGWYDDGRVAAVTFTSSSTVRNFVEVFGGRDAVRSLVARVVIACIGPITACTAEEYGLTVTVMPAENTVPALAEAIVRYFKEGARVAVSTRG